MYKTLQPALQKELASIKEAGLFKKERIITTPQGAEIKTSDGKEVINFCANNYLGLSSHPREYREYGLLRKDLVSYIHHIYACHL